MPNTNAPTASITCSVEELMAGCYSADPTSEARRAPRKRMTVPGLIGVPGYRLHVPCRVVDMSATGACAELVSPPGRNKQAAELPDRVVLILPHERVEVDCRVQWRQGGRFGVRFLSAMCRVQSSAAPARHR